MERNKEPCLKCNRQISKSNYNRHLQSCNGIFFEGPNQPRQRKDPIEVQKIRELNLKKARESLKNSQIWNKGKIFVDESKVFSLAGKGPIKKLFLSKVKYCCSECGLSEWNNKAITLDLDHINGNHIDNRIENLRLLCPNCHSQTSTYKNKGSKIKRVSDAALISAIISSKNISEVLIKVGLRNQGTHYKRINRIINEYNVKPNWLK